MTVGASADGGSDVYAGAGQHYTSPTRRDWVKRAWEEPAFHRHLDDVLRRAHAAGLNGTLDVLDVGCGTGVALDLLLATPALVDGTLTLGRATGLDLDEALLAIARERFSGDPRVGFVSGDLTTPPDTGPHDLVLSSGVPFSHLGPEDLERSLTRLAATALGTDSDADGRSGGGRSALLVVDVLGRYSLEWTTRWDEVRWDYRMSFFTTDVDVTSTPMTTWAGTDLAMTIERSASAAGATLTDLTLVDRSIAIGRHTMTGEYTPDLPRLRDLVDALVDPEVTVDPAELRIALTLPDAPPDVLALHRAFASAWNGALDAAASEGTRGPALAERLRDLEAGFEGAGLGVGHSLTAFALLSA
jgi:SAM-dependent methyltransferase